MNAFFQLKDGKLFAMTPPVATPPIFVLKKVLSGGKTYPTGWRGTGRAFIADTGGKRGHGKPPAAARLRGDLIVAYVRELQRDNPRRKLDSDIIRAAMRHFRISSAQTIWNALKADRKLGPYEPMPPGPIRFSSARPHVIHWRVSTSR